jgi:hypothetical protein
MGGNMEQEQFNSIFNRISELAGKFVSELQKMIAEIPKPTFTLPKFDFDYEKFKNAVDSNTVYGWALTAHMPFNLYIEAGVKIDNLTHKDEFFTRLFESDDYDLYKNEKETILELVCDKWKSLLYECFEAIENNKNKIVIPSLFIIIEGELSRLAQSNDIGKRLVNSTKESLLKNSDDRMIYLVAESLFTFLDKHLFKTHKFNTDRPIVINRNWVLHGRDNPEEWTKTVYKLLTVLSSIVFISYKI